MFYNHYSVLFRKLPLTIQDQSNNLIRFFDAKSVTDIPTFQTFPTCLSSALIQQIHKERPLKDDLLHRIVRELFPFIPLTVRNRSFIGLADLVCLPLSIGRLEKVNTVFDNDGNFSLLSFFIFLEPFRPINWIFDQSIFPVHPSPGLGVLFDHRMMYKILPGKENLPLVLQVKCLYNLLPDPIFSLPLYEQIVLWRGQMKKCFMNSGSFVGSGHSMTSRVEIQQLEDPAKDQCDSCLQFIPITSVTCPVCSDRLIPQNEIILSRQNGIWISREL